VTVLGVAEARLMRQRFLRPVRLDRDLKTDGRISFHPNINTATFVIALADFERFLASRRNVVRYVTIDDAPHR
jgi:hypothetical protein